MKTTSSKGAPSTSLRSFSVPTADEQLLFLRNIQRLLTEGQFVSSYKYALLHALTDLAVLKGDDSGAPLPLSIREIVERMAELYWVQAAPFDGTNVLRQSTATAPALLEELQAARMADLDSFSTLAASGKRWRRILHRSTRAVGAQPIPRLQTIGREKVPFLYDRGPSGHVTLKPGVAFCLRAFRGLITELVQAAWLRFVRKWNPGLERGPKDLSSFLFGSSRASSAEVREQLMEVQNGRCFYCGRAAGSGEVDHFIPWSRYPNDLLPNLVLTDTICNVKKSDMLAAERHLERWIERLASSALLDAMGVSDGPTTEAGVLSRSVALWAYGAAATGQSQVWVIGDRLESLGGRWKALLSEASS